MAALFTYKKVEEVEKEEEEAAANKWLLGWNVSSLNRRNKKVSC